MALQADLKWVHLSIIGFVAAKAAIDFLLNIGMDKVESRLMAVTGYLIKKLEALGIQFHSPLDPDHAPVM